ncbi:MAG: 50S ribosomal protein L17 [Candidatus Omnitrophica bacterium]|nr:50S ribosomal protein L17 [Candidatus Omnitrophota bacterium]
MRHRVVSQRLSRNSSHRTAMLSNMAASLILAQRITTTVAKAREAQRLTDRLITLGKQGDLSARRRAFRILQDRDLVQRLFGKIAPLFTATRGGYTRVIRLGPRHGDGASLAILELTQQLVTAPKPAKPRKAKVEERPGTKPVKPEERPAKPVRPAVAEEAPSKPRPSRHEAPAKQSPKKGLFEGLRGWFTRKKPDA